MAAEVAPARARKLYPGGWSAVAARAAAAWARAAAMVSAAVGAAFSDWGRRRAGPAVACEPGPRDSDMARAARASALRVAHGGCGPWPSNVAASQGQHGPVAMVTTPVTTVAVLLPQGDRESRGQPLLSGNCGADAGD